MPGHGPVDRVRLLAHFFRQPGPTGPRGPQRMSEPVMSGTARYTSPNKARKIATRITELLSRTKLSSIMFLIAPPPALTLRSISILRPMCRRDSPAVAAEDGHHARFAFRVLPGAVYVGVAEGHRGQAVDSVVIEEELLHAGLCDPVGGDGAHRVLLVGREVVLLPVEGPPVEAKMTPRTLWRSATSRSRMEPRMLTRASKSGASTDRHTLICAAWWLTTSGRSRAKTASRSPSH